MAQQCTRKIQVRADSAYCVGQACEGLFPGTVAAPSPAIVSTGTGTTGGSLGGGYMWAPRHSFVTFDFLGKLYVISGVESHESDETASTADFRHDVWSSQVYIYICIYIYMCVCVYIYIGKKGKLKKRNTRNKELRTSLECVPKT